MCSEPPYWFFRPEYRKGLSRINWPLFELLDKASVSYIDRIMVQSHVSARYINEAYNTSATVVRAGADPELFHKALATN